MTELLDNFMEQRRRELNFTKDLKRIMVENDISYITIAEYGSYTLPEWELSFEGKNTSVAFNKDVNQVNMRDLDEKILYMENHIKAMEQ